MTRADRWALGGAYLSAAEATPLLTGYPHGVQVLLAALTGLAAGRQLGLALTWHRWHR